MLIGLLDGIKSASGAARRLYRHTRGVALIEFAFVLPILLLIIMYGLELANFAIQRQRVSELAMQVADNASRMGGTLPNILITEAMINDVFIGAKLQGGDSEFANNTRIILSSVRMNALGSQWINWQRCYGTKAHPSSYGKAGDGMLDLSFPGIGPKQLKAPATLAVMFVEISANYKPLISSYWAPATEITDREGFLTRDNRNIDLLPVNPDLVIPSTC